MFAIILRFIQYFKNIYWEIYRTLEKTTSKQDIKTTEGIPKEKQNADSSQNDTPTSIIGVLVSLIVIMTISGIVIGFVILRKWKTWKRQLGKTIKQQFEIF